VRFAADAARDGAQVGVHTGLLTLHGSQTSGPALEGARELAAMAAPGEVLLTGAVADLTAGSELRPTERAGRPGVWSLAGGAT
jgi:class 3 adenylate cyclase